MDRDAVPVGHLVELVDANHPAVRQHHRPGLEPLLARVLVGRDGRGQTDAGRAASRGRDGERRDVHHGAEQLGLGDSGVPDHEDVDVAVCVQVEGSGMHYSREEGA